MLLFVIIFNCCLTIVNICLVVCLWRIYCRLQFLNQILGEIQLIVETVLPRYSPSLTFKGYTVDQLKNRYQKLITQVNFWRQIIFLINLKIKSRTKKNFLFLR